MRTEADRLQWPTDCARCHELAGSDRGSVLQTFAVADRVDLAGLLLNATCFGELVEAGECRFIAQVVLTAAHRCETDAASFTGDGRASKQADRVILEDFRLAACLARLREAPRELRRQV